MSSKGRVIAHETRHSIQRRLRLVDIDVSLFMARAMKSPSAVAQIEGDLHISSEVEFEARLGRCSLANSGRTASGSPRAQPRQIDPPNRSQSISEHCAYDLFTSDVSADFFIATFAALNGGTTLVSAAGSLLTEESPIIAISGWHRKEEVTVYDESELVSPLEDGGGGDGATSARPSRLQNQQQRRRFRVLLDSSRASYCINAHTFDKNDADKSVASLLSYLECEEATSLTTSSDGCVWATKEERIVPDPIWWLSEDTPTGTSCSANKTPHKLCVEKDKSSQCVLGSTDSSLCDVRFSLCHERNRTEMLPDSYLQACDAPQRVQALIQSGFPQRFDASGGRSSFSANNDGDTSAEGHTRTGQFDTLASDMAGLSLSADDPDMIAIISALQGSLLEMDAVAGGDLISSSALSNHNSTLSTSVTSRSSSSSKTSKASTSAAATISTKRGRPPKAGKTSVDATTTTSQEADKTTETTSLLNQPPALAPRPLARLRFGVPPIYRIKLRQSVLLGLNVAVDEEICALIFPHLATQLGENDAAVTAVMSALRKRPLWRVDFTKVWQSDALSRARGAYRRYAKTANNPSVVDTESLTDTTNEDVSPSSYEIEIECVDVVYWCTLLCQCNSSMTPDDALAVIASAMLTLTSSGVLSTVLPSVRSHLSSDLGSLLPPLWVVRPKVASF